MNVFRVSLLALLYVGSPSAGMAEQPIFDEMPRWSGGWGIQLLEEYRTENDRLDGTRTIGDGLEEHIHILHLQGVYTWHKSIRMTAKLPFVLYAEREILGPNGGFITQEDNGIGDLTLALPLKKYFNLDGRTGSWTLTPTARIPLSPDDEYEVYDRRWGSGLGIGYATETHLLIIETSLTGWVVYGGPPHELFSGLSLGRNFSLFGTNGHIKWKNVVRYQSDGSLTYRAGPLLYMRITDTVHTQFQWQHDFYDRQGTPRNGNGNSFRLGVGFVY
jgi:hypothetical protein